MSIIDESLAIGEKETTLAMRFKFAFFADSMISPLMRIMPFLLVYWGFFLLGQGTAAIGNEVTSQNFVVFLVLGMLADVFFFSGWSTFLQKFTAEKYWQTVDATLLAPINRLSLIFGVGLAEAISLFPSTLMFLALCFFLMPISFVNLALVLFALLLLFTVSLSIGLIVGCAGLFNENFVPLFGYMRIVVVFFSCFYYPLEVLRVPQFGAIGGILPTIAYFNPIYQGVNVIRSIWLHGIVPFEPLMYLLFFAVVAPLAAVYLFRRLFRVMSVQGY
ncbi:MAG: ABC transporter permease [Candidatus Diapherotrites archaeon]